MSAFDAIVVGAGVIGAGTAFALARSGFRVALLDTGPVGSAPGETGGTSRASFAWINATAKTDREDYHRLNAAGVEHYRSLAREFGEARLGLHPTGMIAWANPDDDDRRRALRGQVERLREWNSPVTSLDESGLRTLEPHVTFARGAEGFLAYGDAWLDAPRAIDLFCERIRAEGGTVHFGAQGRVDALLRDDAGAVRGVRAGSRRLAAPVVVAALGPDTENTLRAWLGPGELGNRPFLDRRPGLLVDIPDTGSFRLVRHVLYTGDNAFHMRPEPAGGIRIGSEDADPPQGEAPDDRKARVLALLARARALIPAIGGDVPLDTLARECTARVGVRPVPADDRTIIGPVGGAPGLYVIVTHSGVTLGPWLGELATEEIASGAMPPELAPFRFDRFA
ncbi:MAG: FAD-binding oxidoreductase [Immundisolibacterales bacterium]|nr:FAD-binding oxidoreductase [Immundisolibacterales bacterium]